MALEDWERLAAENPMVTVEDRQVLDAALTALADDERQIVLLHAVTGWKHREIAGLLELPLSTVLSKYRRALLKLKTKLEGGMPCDRSGTGTASAHRAGARRARPSGGAPLPANRGGET